MLRLLWIRLKAAVSCIWVLVSRAICCFRRRRKLSSAGLPISVDVQSVPGTDQVDPEPNWTWEEQLSAVVTVQDKIRAYRETRSRLSESEQQSELDYFSDMTPTIKRAQKLLVSAGESDGRAAEPRSVDGVSSRLAYTASAIVPQVAELTDLDEPSAWDVDDIQPDALQNHQRSLRQQKLQRKRQQLVGPPVR